MTNRWFLLLIAGLLLTAMLVACAVPATPQVVKQTVVVEKEAPAESTFERIKRTGIVRAGFFLAMRRR